MDRQDIREEVRRLVQDTDSGNYKWSDDVMNARIDQAHERVASLTKCIPTRVETSVVADTQEYALPEFYLDMVNVQLLKDGVWVTLEKRTETELDSMGTAWRNATGTPSDYFVRRNKVGLYPTPKASITDGLRLDIVKRPTVMDEDTDIPFDGIYELYPFHDSIVYEVCRVCKLDEKLYQESVEFEKQVAIKVNEIKNQILSKQSFTRLSNVYEIDRQGPRRTA